MVAELILQFFVDPDNPIFARKITGSLFVLGQELKQKNYPPTPSLTSTVAGAGCQALTKDQSRPSFKKL